MPQTTKPTPAIAHTGPLLDRPLMAILLGSLIWRAFLAHIFPLTTDEAYGLVAGRSFSLSFYDHPPLSFWLPAATEWMLGGSLEFVLRLPVLAIGTLTLWGFYLVGLSLGGPKVGRVAAILAAFTPYITLSGVTTVPDSLLLMGLIFCLYALIRLAKGEDQKIWLWALGSLSLAIALASKYQALFVPLGILIWLLSSPRHCLWLLKPTFWIAGVVASLGTLPILIWNMQNDWASFTFHSGRTEATLNLSGFLSLFVGQFAYFSPLILALVIWQTTPVRVWQDPLRRLLLIAGLTIFLFFNAIFFVASSGLPHWPLSGAALLLPLVALSWQERLHMGVRITTLGTLFISQLVVLLIGLHVSFGILSAGQNPPPDWDRTMPLARLSSLRHALDQSELPFDDHPIYARNWLEAGHLGVALGSDIPIRVLGSETNHFGFLPSLPTHNSAYMMGLALKSEAPEFTQDIRSLAEAKGFRITETQTFPVRRGQPDYQALIILTLEAL